MTTDEKGVFIQIQNTIVSSKALVMVNCLNTLVHDCRYYVISQHAFLSACLAGFALTKG